MATASVSPAGTSRWPLKSLPQATTRPSARKARLCQAPAATATTLEASEGKLIWPNELSPHAATWTTASVALELSAEPRVLLTSTEYDPLFVWQIGRASCRERV